MPSPTLILAIARRTRGRLASAIFANCEDRLLVTRWRRVASAQGGRPHVHVAGDNAHVDLARIGWLATVLACLLTVLILVLQGYYGYAGVTFAVGAAAAINLA